MSIMSRTAARPRPCKSSRSSLAFSSGFPPLTSSKECTCMPNVASGVTSYSFISPSSNSHTLEGPAIDSSSSPSKPCTTNARFIPNALKTSAYNNPRLNEKTPANMQSGFAGLVSGPNMLKTVRMPSCCRTGPTCFIAGWYERANKNAKPLEATTAGTSSADTSNRAPNASKMSAAPLVDEAARFPCLTTFAPAAAARNAAAVDILKVS
mmetsp:Transcript_109292/g.172221  ORF Transcript_109292/g.172221 Transcript_109292/m.172221 type:complete len:209 (-) Transcript_109292:322-948(-)